MPSTARSRRRLSLAVASALWLSACAAPAVPPVVPRATLEQQVADTERAFAKTMADRDHAGFSAFLADDTVFFSGPTPLRGKAAVAAGWKRFYEGDQPPFSWRPDKVEVLDSGELALSTGPVFDPDGKPVASFTSVWRRVSPGVWRIVFDKGCNCP